MATQLELLHPEHRPQGRLRAAVFDFDGTISTLRCGWEQVMQPLMLEALSPGQAPSPALTEEVARYIDESTGIQTIFQMQWLAEEAAKRTGVRRDPWDYKAEYNRRLMESVERKKQALAKGEKVPEDYRVAGSVDFLLGLRDRGINLYLASGTDHADVLREAALLGVRDLFTEIAGAPDHKTACSKEAVLDMLFQEKALSGDSLLVVGDGKVEIALGCRYGAYTLGAATDEERRRGLNPVKRERLVNAGADAVTGDFSDTDALFRWLD